jgi:hypothetical protein
MAAVGSPASSDSPALAHCSSDNRISRRTKRVSLSSHAALESASPQLQRAAAHDTFAA